MRVSVVQMQPGSDKAQNLRQAEALIDQAVASDRPDLVVLPEIWTCLGGTAADKLAASEILPTAQSGQDGGNAYELLRRLARRHAIHVHGGSIGERDAGRLFNTSLVFDPEGREIARYRKIHLFDITTPDGTGYRESATYGAGNQIVTCNINGMCAGLAICYDLRFPELFLQLRRQGAELILLPAAFTLQTGRDHWEMLIRARAIETQCWFAAAATSGTHHDGQNEPRQTWGHAMICDPWGKVVAGLTEGTGFATASLDPGLLARVRRDMPVLEHRRLREGSVA